MRSIIIFRKDTFAFYTFFRRNNFFNPTSLIKMSMLAYSEDPDEMLHKVTFQQGLHGLLRQCPHQIKIYN